MPEISRFFGIVVLMYYNDHAPPHIHAEFQGGKALVDFNGNILRGDLASKTAVRLVREWIDLHVTELGDDWDRARSGSELRPIEPLK